MFKQTILVWLVLMLNPFVGFANDFGGRAGTVVVPPPNTNQNNSDVIDLGEIVVTPETSGQVTDVNDLQEVEIDARRIGEGYDECGSAHTKAKVSCTGNDITRQVAPLLLVFNRQNAAANGGKDACETANKISKIGAGATAGFVAGCKVSQSSCVSSCGMAIETARANNDTQAVSQFQNFLKDCNGYRLQADSATLQGVEFALHFAQSTNCRDDVGGECADYDLAKNNKNCPAYCTVPGRFNDEACNYLVAQCKDPTLARTNPNCVCITNPNSAQCANGTVPLTPPTPTTVGDGGSKPGSWFDGLFGDDAPPEFGGNGETRGAGLAGAPSGGGSAAPAGGASGSGFQPGGDDGGGYGGNPTDNKILNGVARTGGGSGMTYGSSASGGNGAYRGGGGSGSNAKELNLRDFLPGGKKDTRAIASQTLQASGISASNGLTNWVKVSRKMAEKKPSLLP